MGLYNRSDMNILPDDELPFDASMLDRLAMVAIRVGLNLQPGQDLIITGPVEALPLIRRISAEAYKNEAGVVSTILSDDELQLTRYKLLPLYSRCCCWW